MPYDIGVSAGEEIGISFNELQTDYPTGALGNIVAPGSLADYMGEAPGSVVTGVVDITPYIGYMDIFIITTLISSMITPLPLWLVLSLIGILICPIIYWFLILRRFFVPLRPLRTPLRPFV